ncbi:MAG: 30S ribosomal protein S4 [Candidatus Pacebacteria bacterium CG_4_10_14_0_8_um_filter_43_12]|nr:MAG: 30S ribosomal protein S4 [Candidatus Pacebacteria bacterium CG10_big_fil_rev_8_21_14_0_10_44_11]PIY79533.1 MAG: 30S ribosomal protein S4 [Candidatus Pacebacteria bacterium CG_4_10_14_0_8_um_filter_43_12]
MSRYTGPRVKLSRKIGEDLGLKSNSVKVSRRLAIRPGQHGARGRRKLSDYGIQLKEKQKIKYIYGLTESQLRKLYEKATRSELATGELLLSLLERRLDNVVYRLGWANTRAAARQLVSHGHLVINGRKMDVPSYETQVEDVVTLTGRATKIMAVSEALKSEAAVPGWLEKKQAAAKITQFPQQKDISEVITVQLVIEYYSR